MSMDKETCEFCKHWEEAEECEMFGTCNNYKSPFYDRAMGPDETCPGFTEI